MPEPDSRHVRPTKRALADLSIEVPEIDQPLCELDNVHIRGVQEIPKWLDASGARRVVELKDRVWYKYKLNATRGVATELAEGEVPNEVIADPTVGRWWAGAFGPRNADSPQRDFYSQLVTECVRHGKGASAGGPTTDHLLPQQWDIRRLVAELSIQWVDAIEKMVVGMIAESLRTGKSVEAQAQDHLITAAVRATSREEAYLTISALGVPDNRVLAAVLNSVPGISADDWMPDQLESREGLDLTPDSGEIIYSTLLSAEVQANVLEAAGNDPLALG